MTFKSFLKAGCAAVVVLAFATPALAQAPTKPVSASDNEIVVTATKRATTIQDVPFSINAQTQKDIEKSGAVTLEDLSRNVASLAIQNLGPGQSQVAVRGVSAGQIVRDQPGVKEQVGVYLDESVVSLSLFTPDLDLYDLNRVETLRGPQGTLFGSGSVGGTIRYITNQPNTDKTEGQVEANLNTLADGGTGGHLKAMFNSPFAGGKAAIRAVAYHTEFAGFIDALRQGGRIDEDVNSGTRSGGRIALTFKPTSNITITPRLIYQEIKTDGFNRQEVFNLYANPFTTTRAPVRFAERQQFLLLSEEFKDQTFIGDLTANVAFDGFDLTSVTSYTDRDILVSRDASALTHSVSIDLRLPASILLTPSNLRDTSKVEQITQEVRVASNGSGAFKWLLGAFYSDTDRTYAQRLPTPGYDAATDVALGAGTAAATRNGFGVDSPYNSDLPYNLRQVAVFGEASYDLTDKLTVTAGGRYYDYKEKRSFTSGGLFSNGDRRNDRTSSDGFSPRVVVSYEAMDGVKLNAQASKGFRLGGVNDPLNVPLCNATDRAQFGGFQSYRDETLWNYEAGAKISRGGVTLNAAAFYTDIKDLQVTLDAGSCSSRISFNVPEAHSQGLEAELSVRPVRGLDLSLSGSIVEAEFDSTVRDSAGAVLGGVASGNRLASVPKYQFAANARYSFPASWAGSDAEAFVGASVQTIGSRFTQPGDQVAGAGAFSSRLAFGGATGTEVTRLNLELSSYTLVNLNAGLSNGPWDLLVFVNNVADENANLAFDRERGGRARLGFSTNAPRTFGATVRRSF
ncbi:MAG: TonB-dependent receptor [Caulobacterales bacterium]